MATGGNDRTTASALQAATNFNQIEAMRYMLERETKIDRGIICYAKTKEVFQVPLGHGLDINGSTGHCQVLLMHVVSKNDPSLLRWFLSKGADPNLGPPATGYPVYVDPQGELSPNSGGALEIAASYSDPVIVDILIEHGGCTAAAQLLFDDTFRGLTEISKWLLEHGADINIKEDDVGMGALGYASLRREGTFNFLKQWKKEHYQ
ncbi:hypothetical protein BBP40_012141 [Aspergillus hancockii]|nr:hypothetical protein BBP40_012141 [Aspergillus hancockii]